MPVDYLESNLTAESCAERIGAGIAEAAKKSPGLDYRQQAEGRDLLLIADMPGRAKLTVTVRPAEPKTLLRVEIVFGKIAKVLLAFAAVACLAILPLVGYFIPEPIFPGTPNVVVFAIFGVLVAVVDVVVLGLLFRKAIRGAVRKIAEKLQATPLEGSRRIEVAEAFRTPESF